MKLDPAGVEKAARAMFDQSRDAMGEWDDTAYMWREEATAALTAYFDHLKEAGKMRECRVWDHSGSDYWSANTGNAPMKVNDFMGVIIREEEQ